MGKKIGSGAFNNVYLSDDARFVIKYPIRDKDNPDPIDDALNESVRAVRIWNEINPALQATLCEDGSWKAPYLGIARATDEETAMAIVDIFKRTRRIIADGSQPENFLTFEGKTYCVDVDAALLPPRLSQRRNSIASSNFFPETSKYKYARFWQACERLYGRYNSVAVIKNLLYLVSCLEPEDIQDYHINYQVISALTSARLKKLAINKALLELISAINTHGHRIPRLNQDLLDKANLIARHDLPLNNPLIDKALSLTKEAFSCDLRSYATNPHSLPVPATKPAISRQSQNKEIDPLTINKKTLSKIIDHLIGHGLSNNKLLANKNDKQAKLSFIRNNLNNIDSKQQFVNQFQQLIDIVCQHRNRMRYLFSFFASSKSTNTSSASLLIKILNGKIDNIPDCRVQDIKMLCQYLELPQGTKKAFNDYLSHPLTQKSEIRQPLLGPGIK